MTTDTRPAEYAADFRADCAKIDRSLDRLSPDQLAFYRKLRAEAEAPGVDVFHLLGDLCEIEYIIAPTLCGIMATPNAVTPPGQKTHGEASELSFPPRITIGDDGRMYATTVGYDSPSPRDCLDTWVVREVTRLHKRGLVILDTDIEVIIMTEEEFNSQV